MTASAIFFCLALACLFGMLARPRESWLGLAIAFILFGAAFVVSSFVESARPVIEHSCGCSECDCVAAPDDSEARK